LKPVDFDFEQGDVLWHSAHPYFQNRIRAVVEESISCLKEFRSSKDPSVVPCFRAFVQNILLETSAEQYQEEYDPAEDGIDPAADGMDPAADGIDPAADGINPAADGIDPTANGLDPAADGIDPAADGINPAADDINTAANGVDPAANGIYPAADIVEHDAAAGRGKRRSALCYYRSWGCCYRR
jgi:hypothetical protein